MTGLKLSPNLRVFITGKTQSGKTTLVKKLLCQLQNFIIFDVKWQYSSFGAVVHNLSDVKAAFHNGVTKVVYQPLIISVEDFDLLCEFILKFLKNIMLLIEEIQNVVSKHSIPVHFKALLTMSQGDSVQYASNVGIISISQRPANVHNDVITQSTIIISFKLHPSDADSIVLIPAEIILSLKLFEFVVFDDRLHDNNVFVHPPI